MSDAGLVVLSAFISPFRADRDMVRELMESGEFVEIHVKASLRLVKAAIPRVCMPRPGPARSSISPASIHPNEPPEHPDVVLDNRSAVNRRKR